MSGYCEASAEEHQYTDEEAYWFSKVFLKHEKSTIAMQYVKQYEEKFGKVDKEKAPFGASSN